MDHVGAATAAAARVDDSARKRFALDGYFNLPSVVDGNTCRTLAGAVRRLTALGAPAVLVYVYDQLWNLLPDLVAVVESLTRARYGATTDVWAWHLLGGQDVGGWRPHRGTSSDPCQINAEGLRQPALVNVWIPLLDVDQRNACMWVVPLRSDRDYPMRLDRVTPTSSAQALPARAGSAVGWDSNVLHWGGQMMSDPALERIALSFTLARYGAKSDDVRGLDEARTFEQRLALLASLAETYAAMTSAGDAAATPAIRLAAAFVRLNSVSSRSGRAR